MVLCVRYPADLLAGARTFPLAALPDTRSAPAQKCSTRAAVHRAQPVVGCGVGQRLHDPRHHVVIEWNCRAFGRLNDTRDRAVAIYRDVIARWRHVTGGWFSDTDNRPSAGPLGNRQPLDQAMAQTILLALR